MFYPAIFEWKSWCRRGSNDVIRMALDGLARS